MPGSSTTKRRRKAQPTIAPAAALQWLLVELDPPASQYQTAVWRWIVEGSGHGQVGAVAGSGKTTLLVHAARLIPADKKAVFVAFNKDIVEELQDRLAGTSLRAKTIHGLAFGVLIRYLGGMPKLDDRKYRKIAAATMQQVLAAATYRNINPATLPTLDQGTQVLVQLADLCRLTCTDPRDMQAMDALIDHHGVDIDPTTWPTLRPLVGVVLDVGDKVARNERVIDYTDMIALPLRWDLAMPQHEWLLVDEAQDLNRCQFETLLRCCALDGRMLFVGDQNQAIYGFAGADSESWHTIQQRTHATQLPLSISYRCPTSHIVLAKAIVPQIEARPGAPEGTIEYVAEDQATTVLRDGDMVICRLTAPLITLCIQLIAKRMPARVRGRDIGKALTDIVEQVLALPGANWGEFGRYLAQYEQQQVEKLAQRDASEGLIQAVRDRCAGVQTCYESFNAPSAGALCREIAALFSDDRVGITLSTVHRAKGLQSERVAILKPTTLPLRYDNQQVWELEQELNLKYVALTRSQNTLIFFDEPSKHRDDERGGGDTSTDRALLLNVEHDDDT